MAKLDCTHKGWGQSTVTVVTRAASPRPRPRVAAGKSINGHQRRGGVLHPSKTLLSAPPPQSPPLTPDPANP